MRQPEEVAAELLHDGVVVRDVLLGEGRCLPGHVLMHGHAPERVRLSVEAEAFVLVDAEIAEADFGAGDILVDLDFHRVKVRVQDAVPEVRVVQGQDRRKCLAGSGGEVDVDGLLPDHFPRGVLEQHCHFLRSVFPGIPEVGAYFCNHLIVSHFFLDHMQAVRPVFLRREEDIAVHQQADGIVEAAVLVEVGADGNHLDVLRVVADHFHLAAVRERHDEGRVAALMGLQERAVQVHFRRLGRALEEQEGVLPGGEGDFPAVMGLATVILLRGAVLGVVGVGDRDGFPLLPVLGELPVFQFGLHAAGDGEEGKGHEARQQVFHRLDPLFSNRASYEFLAGPPKKTGEDKVFPGRSQGARLSPTGPGCSARPGGGS